MAADEAVLRIVLQDAGGTGVPQYAQSYPSYASQGQASAPTISSSSRGGRGRPGIGADAIPPEIFGLVDDIFKLVEDAPQAAVADATLAFDPAKEAKKRFEQDKKRAAIDAEYAKLVPITATLAFDPVEEAKKRLERDKQRLAIDKEYAKLVPPDPSDKSGSFKGALDVAGMFRGTIGGTLGTTAGAALDVASATAEVAEMGGAAAGVVPVLGVLAVAAIGAGKAISELMREADEAAQRYGTYSPEIAQAQAAADVRQTFGDLRRAQEAGPELARYVDAQSQLQQKYEDIKVKLLTKMLEILNPMLEILERIMPSGDATEVALNAMVPGITAIASAANMIASLMPDPRDREVHDPTDLILNRPLGINAPLGDENVVGRGR